MGSLIREISANQKIGRDSNMMKASKDANEWNENEKLWKRNVQQQRQISQNMVHAILKNQRIGKVTNTMKMQAMFIKMSSQKRKYSKLDREILALCMDGRDINLTKIMVTSKKVKKS